MLWKSLLGSCLALASVSCGKDLSDSARDGASDLKTDPQSSPARIIAEYEPTKGVIMAVDLLGTFAKTEMAMDMLNMGIDSLWIPTPKDESTGDLMISKTLKTFLAGAGDNAAKVIPLPTAGGSDTIWARDWSPISTMTADHQLNLLDFRYGELSESDREEWTARLDDDAVPSYLADYLHAAKTELPLLFEGGNFMVNRQGHCLIGEDIVIANREQFSRERILQLMKTKAGCKEVSLFPGLPYESTGHIDLWAKFVNDDTVLVGAYRDEVIDYVGSRPFASAKLEAAHVREMGAFLDARAEDIAALGFTVVRMPMPNPSVALEMPQVPSYLNALLLNGNALVPVYSAKFNAFPGYDAEARKIYEDAGFIFHAYNFDNSLAYGGAIHCATMQVPR